MTDSEIITQILEHYNLKPNSFAKMLGLDRGDSIYQILNGRNRISNRMSELILQKFPELSKVWLRSGEGNMFVDKRTTVSHPERIEPVIEIVMDEKVNYSTSKDIDLLKLVASQQRTIEKLTDIISEYTSKSIGTAEGA